MGKFDHVKEKNIEKIVVRYQLKTDKNEKKKSKYQAISDFRFFNIGSRIQ